MNNNGVQIRVANPHNADDDQIVPEISDQHTGVDEECEDGFILVDKDNIPPEAEVSFVNQQSSWLSVMPSLPSISVPDMSSIPDMLNGWLNESQEVETKQAEHEERHMTYVAEKLEQCKDLHDELEHRTCLVKSLIKHRTKVMDGTRLTDDDFKRMKSEKCIHTKDCEYITEKNSLCSEKMLFVFLMMLLRDFKTMLIFLTYLNPETYDEIVRCFEELLKGKTNVTKIRTSCTWCVMTSSVNIVYVVADLLRCGSGPCDIANWVKVNMEAVSVIGDMKKSDNIWKMVQEIVCGRPELKSEVVDILIESLDECAFHSDVVRLLQEDKTLGKDSLRCMCADRQADSDDRLKCVAEDDNPTPLAVRRSEGAEGSVDAASSKRSSLKRKNSQCENGFIKKKSLDDEINRSSDGKKPTEKIDNSKMSDSDDESDEFRLDNLKIGILEYDEGIGESFKSCEPVSKDSEETEPKQVCVNIESCSSNSDVTATEADNTEANVDVASSTDTLQPSMSEQIESRSVFELDVPPIVDVDEGVVLEEGQGQSLESNAAGGPLSILNESYLMEPSDSNQQELNEADAFINVVPNLKKK